MEAYRIKEVIDKLIGPITPIGESNEDSKRLKNVKVQCEVVSELISELKDVGDYVDRYEHSMHQAGAYACTELGDIYITLKEYFDE